MVLLSKSKQLKIREQQLKIENRRVRITLKDGTRLEGWVQETNETSLTIDISPLYPSGLIKVIRWADIQKIEVAQFDARKTAIAAGVTFVVLGVLFLLVWYQFLEAFGEGAPGMGY